MAIYEASIIAVCFDKKYKFKDILHLGIAHSKEEAKSILFNEMHRLYEDYENDDGKKVPIKYRTSRSQYDEPIEIFEYLEGFEHIYCLFTEESTKSLNKEKEK